MTSAKVYDLFTPPFSEFYELFVRKFWAFFTPLEVSSRCKSSPSLLSHLRLPFSSISPDWRKRDFITTVVLVTHEKL